MGAPPVSSVWAGRAENSHLSLYADTDAPMNLLSSRTMWSLEEAEGKIVRLLAIRCFSPMTCKSYKFTHTSHTPINLVTDSKYYPISIIISIVFRNNSNLQNSVQYPCNQYSSEERQIVGASFQASLTKWQKPVFTGKPKTHYKASRLPYGLNG